MAQQVLDLQVVSSLIFDVFSNGYGKDDFKRADYGTQGSYGGKQNAGGNVS